MLSRTLTSLAQVVPGSVKARTTGVNATPSIFLSKAIENEVKYRVSYIQN